MQQISAPGGSLLLFVFIGGFVPCLVAFFLTAMISGTPGVAKLFPKGTGIRHQKMGEAIFIKA